MNCPVTTKKSSKIEIAHGGGGRMSDKLIKDVFIRNFSNEYLDCQHDGAVFSLGNSRMAYSTDSFVVKPLFFNGGDIGDLAINGTVNDLTACGAKPLFISAAFIIEEGTDIEIIEKIAISMSKAAEKAGVKIVTGDTKVVENGKGDGIYINTSGIGVIPENVIIASERIKAGDSIIITGNIASHGMCIISERSSLGFEADIKSDTASLNRMIAKVAESVDIHMMRDPTRGGVSSVLNEIAESASLSIMIEEDAIPIEKKVSSFCELLGFDPLGVANEGIMILFVSPQDSSKTLEILKEFEEGKNSCIIGRIDKKDVTPVVTARTIYGSKRTIDMISGEQLPRIC